jgi:peptide/nickel transport system substrate-binding protein
MKKHGRGLLGGLGVLAIAVAIAVAFVSSSGAASRSSTGSHAEIANLNIGFNTVNSLNPANLGNFVTNALGMENLLKLTNDLKLEPWLATSWSMTSPTTYVYHLRHGVKFSDGTPMTSADVVTSWQTYMAPKSSLAAYYNSVKSVTAPDQYTVKVTLKRPDNGWSAIPALYGWVFEKSFYLAHQKTMGNAGVLIVGTGPWKYDSFDPSTGIEASANPYYWGHVNIQHISMKFLADDNAAALAMRAGEIDLYPQLLTDVKGFMAAAGSNVQLIGANDRCGMGMLQFNTQRGPLSNIHVRRAIAYAINRNDVLAALAEPDTGPLYTMLTPDQWNQLGTPAQVKAVLETIPTYPFSLAKAKAELAQSPYPHGFTQAADTFNAYGLPIMMQAISGDLKKIGINMTFKSLAIGAWIAKFETKKTTEPMYLDSLGCYYPDAGQFPNLFLSPTAVVGSYPWSIFRYQNPAINKLTTVANQTTNKAKRLALYGQILRLEAADLPYLPLNTEAYFGAISKKYSFDGFGWFGGDYWPWPLGVTAK